MTENIATFYTHLGALRFERRLKKLGESAAMSPVPRKLSASCGTCVRFTATFQNEWADEDLEAVYESVGEGQYRLIYENSD